MISSDVGAVKEKNADRIKTVLEELDTNMNAQNDEIDDL